jgi:hypothetical protein
VRPQKRPFTVETKRSRKALASSRFTDHGAPSDRLNGGAEPPECGWPVMSHDLHEGHRVFRNLTSRLPEREPVAPALAQTLPASDLSSPPRPLETAPRGRVLPSLLDGGPERREDESKADQRVKKPRTRAHSQPLRSTAEEPTRSVPNGTTAEAPQQEELVLVDPGHSGALSPPPNSLSSRTARDRPRRGEVQLRPGERWKRRLPRVCR